MAYVFQAGAEFLVNTQIVNNQGKPSITRLNDGGFIVVWEDESGTLGDNSGTSIKAQRFDATGAKVGSEFLVNTATGLNQSRPSVAALESGGFVITWHDASGTLGDSSSLSVKGQMFDAAGLRTGSEFLVNTMTVEGQLNASVTGIPKGWFIVTWESATDADGTDIRAQVFNWYGTKMGAEIQVATKTGTNLEEPQITALGNTGFVITWHDYNGGSSISDIKGQLFDEYGNKLGTEFVINTQTADGQWRPSIAALENGGFVVTWYDRSGTLGDDSGTSIKAQMFDATGAKSGGEFLVNTYTDLDQYSPAVAGLADGGFVITWFKYNNGTGDTAILAQVYDDSGVRIGGERLVTEDTGPGHEAPVVTALPDGGFVVSWWEFSTVTGDGDGSSVKAKVFTSLATPGTAGNDVLIGTGDGDLINALGGHDSVRGVGGKDTINGGAGNDSLYGEAGNDSLDGGDGDDLLVGGDGNDTLLGGEGNDTLLGDDYGDYLVGGAGDDYIVDTGYGNVDGQFGNDTIEVGLPEGLGAVFAGFGNDVVRSAVGSLALSLGEGRDVLVINPLFSATDGFISVEDFRAGPDGDVLDLSEIIAALSNYSGGDPFASGHLYWEADGINAFLWANMDGLPGGNRPVVRLKSIMPADLTAANFTGLGPTEGNDNLNGTEGNDSISGLGGADNINGLGGNDTLRGGDGNDVIDGGAGIDSLYGGQGDDFYTVDQSADKVIELAGQGIDTVYALANWKASDNVENIYLGAGNISAYGNALANLLVGSFGNNTLSGADGDDTLQGLEGNDKLDGGAGHDRLDGGDGNDALTGGEGSDALDGGAGNDNLNGGARWDTLTGGDGNDILDGGADNDWMEGDLGDDTYVVDHIGDRVVEQYDEGTDTVKASITYSLTADVEVLNLTGTDHISGTGNGLSNSLNGNSGNNGLNGGLGNDSLYGWDGNDSLSGGDDHDRLSGGNGNDTLVGGRGNDVLGGGAGADDFVFSSLSVNGHDHIVDFVHGVDRLVFVGANYGFAAGGTLTEAQFTTGAIAVGSSAQFVWDAAGRHLYFDSDGAGGLEAIELAMISGGATVTKDDIHFV